MSALDSPLEMLRYAGNRFGFWPREKLDVESGLRVDRASARGARHVHCFMSSLRNFGDVLLPIAVRDSFAERQKISWTGLRVHKEIHGADANWINRQSGLVVGGGGLFIRDTAPNAHSGWQWSCPISVLNRIKVPIALFAVGYNRFRGQEDFEPIFTKHVQLLAEKSVYFGMRNSGSIRAMKQYLPESLHGKLRFQPCPTTFVKLLYPDVFRDLPRKASIGVNLAFDRSEKRFAGKEQEIIAATARVLKNLRSDFLPRYLAHHESDLRGFRGLAESGAETELVELYKMPIAQALREIACNAVVIGMRGHAQMIPFGCETPVVSLISHDKLAWFLEDVGKPEWGVEVADTDYALQLEAAIRSVTSSDETVRLWIAAAQRRFYEATMKNVSDYLTATTAC